MGKLSHFEQMRELLEINHRHSIQRFQFRKIPNILFLKGAFFNSLYYLKQTWLHYMPNNFAPSLATFSTTLFACFKKINWTQM